MVSISTSYLLKEVLREQVVQQVDILQPQSSHVRVTDMLLQVTVKRKGRAEIENIFETRLYTNLL